MRRSQWRAQDEGRRIDAEAPPLRSWISESYNSEFEASALIFPTVGCWEVTGKVGKERLTFVVNVVRVAEGPRAQPKYLLTDFCAISTENRNLPGAGPCYKAI